MLKSITSPSSSSSSLPLIFKLNKPSSSSSPSPSPSSPPSSSSFTRCLSLPFSPTNPTPPRVHSLFNIKTPMNNLLCKLGLGPRTQDPSLDSSTTTPQGPDDDIPGPGLEFAEFGGGCFWGVELSFQRVHGVKVTEVGYTQGLNDNPSYEDICTGMTNHCEVVRVQFDPKECSFDKLLDVFWARHDPTTLNRQGNDVGTQYRSGIYFYTPEQEQAAIESRDRQQKLLNRKIVTEILPAKKFYRAEEYHQQYLAKGGRFGFQQSAEKGCNDPIRCYG